MLIYNFSKFLDNSQDLGLKERFRFYPCEEEHAFKQHIEGVYFKLMTNKKSRIILIIYLNHDFLGGETKFYDLSSRPKTGTALYFLHEQKRKGMPIFESKKNAS